MNNKYAIVDIETTGTYAAAHSITEIAILLHDGEKVIERYSTLINPGTTLAPFITRLTGITNDMLRSAPPFHEVAKKIWEMTDDAVFVAHNVNFDYSFIREEFKQLGADFKRKKLCTVRLSRAAFPGQASYSLGTICNQLGIKINDRHRALGDAEATVKLFEKCIKVDDEKHLNALLKRNPLQTVLPQSLPAEKYNDLPESIGVYYFHDANGKIVYVGKAINIKKRIYSHFTGKGKNRLSFMDAIADITYQLCGTELIALLLESDEIKKHFPMYNRVQKFDKTFFVLSEYINQKGIRQLNFSKAHKSIRSIKNFNTHDEACETLRAISDEFELCTRFSGLQSTQGACYNYHLKKCRGVCIGEEDVDIYNKRVEAALKSLTGVESKMIIDEGRSYGERSVILIEEGFYKGFGYFKTGEEPQTIEGAKAVITPFKHSGDVNRILRSIC
ncbi:MAG: GIY-YIG nuclease family protein [Bacteroidetes bacterium]|nr:GIY-YIG nuclease family protein [Bacteroidota bacterium]